MFEGYMDNTGSRDLLKLFANMEKNQTWKTSPRLLPLVGYADFFEQFFLKVLGQCVCRTMICFPPQSMFTCVVS